MSKQNDTPILEAVTVELDDKQRAAKIKALKGVLIQVGNVLPEFNRAKRALEKLKSKAKGFAKDASIERYEIEEPSRVVIKWSDSKPNSTKAKLLDALNAVLGDMAEAQKFLDELMKATDSEGKTILSLKDRSGYFSIGDR